MNSLYFLFLLLTTTWTLCKGCASSQEGLEYLGPTMKELSNIVKSNDCQTLCQDDIECDYWTWFTNTTLRKQSKLKCYLRKKHELKHWRLL